MKKYQWFCSDCHVSGSVVARSLAQAVVRAMARHNEIAYCINGDDWELVDGVIQIQGQTLGVTEDADQI